MTCPWLEPDAVFEGVGAHRANPRYDTIDEDDRNVPMVLRLTQHQLSRTPIVTSAIAEPNTDLYVRRLDGIDGSHYQPDAGSLDLTALRRIPTRWVAWKATQSVAYVDYTLSYVRAALARLDFDHRLYYHWLSSTRDPHEQAAHYLRTIGAWSPGEGVMLDAEESGITEAGCLAWCERIEQTTRRPSAVYTGLYVAGGTIWRSQLLRHSKYGPRPMHLAAYISRDNLLSRMKTLGVLALPVHAWQYSSNGPVVGVTGRCDMNTVVNRDVYDVSCGVVVDLVPLVPLSPEEDDDEMVIITNRDVFHDVPAQEMKWLLMDDGRLRHLAPDEWAARGSMPGIAWPYEAISAAGAWTPDSATCRYSAPPPLTVNLSGTAA